MAQSITYWAREDSTTANNNELNPIGTGGANGVPAFQIYFTDDDPDVPGVDTSGNLALNWNNGLPDPNTSVVINGVSYPFTVEVVGTLPLLSDPGNKIPDIYQGQTVYIISVMIDGVEHEIFFMPDGPQSEALMNDFAASAIPLETFVLACFCEGTGLLAPNGYRPVEQVRVGDFLLNDQAQARQVIWTAMSEVSVRQMKADPDRAPIRIPAGALGHGCPETDLLVSPQHRVVIEGAAPTLLFAEERVLVAAKHLVGSVAEQVIPEQAVRYYHILFEQHEMLVSNGLVSESFQPARRTLDEMSPENQERLVAAITALGVEEMLTRPDALPSLKKLEGIALAAMIRPALPASDRVEGQALLQ